MSDRPKHFSKRVRITTVACIPCQTRKSKCDGCRPVCAACLARNPDDCVYDAAGDQRRTTALKSMNQRLDDQLAACTRQIDDFKDIVRALCRGPVTDATVALLHSLVESDFRTLEDVAASFRGPTDPDTCEGSAAMTAMERSMLMDRIDPMLIQATHPGSLSSPQEMAPSASPLDQIDFGAGPEGLARWDSWVATRPASPGLPYPNDPMRAHANGNVDGDGDDSQWQSVNGGGSEGQFEQAAKQRGAELSEARRMFET